jgi:predicted GNAT family acetyltransferase
VRIVARRILSHGETPFLHAYASNTQAIALYESLGFHIRRRLTAMILVRAEDI